VAIAGSAPETPDFEGEGLFFSKQKLCTLKMTAFLSAMEADSGQFCPSGQT
jgi:hypothetical protein